MTTQDFLKLTPQQKKEGVFIQGDKNKGIFCAWHPNGQIKVKYTFVNGKLDGEFIQYHFNGQIKVKCTYVNGQRHGEYIRYFSDGQIWIKCNYVNGEKTTWRIY